MAVSKAIVNNSNEAKELLAHLRIYNRVVTREEVPGVWVVHYPEIDEEQGQILSIVTTLDFFDSEYFHQAKQILELLNGSRYVSPNGDPIPVPVEDLDLIERAVNKATALFLKIGEFHAGLKEEVRNAEVAHDKILLFNRNRYRKEGNGSQDAGAMAKYDAIPYLERVNECKKNRDHAEVLKMALSKTIGVYMVILSRLKEEYKQRNYEPQE